MTAGFKKAYGDYWEARRRAPLPAAESEIFETVLSIIKPGGALLDAGCGDGAFLKKAARKFDRVCGADIAAPAVKAARGLGYEAVEWDAAEPLPMPEASFDACSCLDVIEHVPDPLKLLKEIRRVLKPGGQLVLSTPNIRCLRHLASLVFAGKFPSTSDDDFVWGGGHLHYFTRKDMLALLGAAGFTGAAFALNPGQFGRSWKRRLARLAAGERLFGEFIEGSVILACFKGE